MGLISLHSKPPSPMNQLLQAPKAPFHGGFMMDRAKQVRKVMGKKEKRRRKKERIGEMERKRVRKSQ